MKAPYRKQVFRTVADALLALFLLIVLGLYLSKIPPISLGNDMWINFSSVTCLGLAAVGVVNSSRERVGRFLSTYETTLGHKAQKKRRWLLRVAIFAICLAGYLAIYISGLIRTGSNSIDIAELTFIVLFCMVVAGVIPMPTAEQSGSNTTKAPD